jgi:hypothetical protein
MIMSEYGSILGTLLVGVFALLVLFKVLRGGG